MTDLILVAILAALAGGIVGAAMRRRSDRQEIHALEQQQGRARSIIAAQDARVAVLEEQLRVVLETPALVLKQHLQFSREQRN